MTSQERITKMEDAMLRISRQLELEPEEFVIFACAGKAAVLAHREVLDGTRYEPLPADDPDEMLRVIVEGWEPTGGVSS